MHACAFLLSLLLLDTILLLDMNYTSVSPSSFPFGSLPKSKVSHLVHAVSVTKIQSSLNLLNDDAEEDACKSAADECIILEKNCRI